MPFISNTLAFLYVFLPFVVFIVAVLLTALVVRTEWRSGLHRLFATFLTAMGLWGLTIALMRSSPNLEIAYQWERFVFVTIVSSSVLFFHFTVRFTRSRISIWVLRAYYALAVLVSALSLSGLVATEMQTKFFGYAPVLGPAFPLYLVVTYLPVLTSIGVLVAARRRSRDAFERRRYDYILLGAFASILGGTSDFLPPLGLNTYPLGIVMNIVFGGLTTVAILRYRLLELRSLLRNGLAYFVVSSVIFGTYGVIFFAFSLLFRNQTTVASIIATVAALFLVAIFVHPVIERAQRFVDRLFFRERYDHLVALERFTQETRDIADFAGLADSLIRTVTLAMQASWVAILVPEAEAEGDDFQTASSSGQDPPIALTIRRRSILARWLQRYARAVEIKELDLDPYLQAMGDQEHRDLQASGVQLFVPMKSKGELTGILVLGPKVFGDDYSAADVDLLTTFTSQAATMIENSRLYSQELARLRELEQLDNLKSNLLRTVSHEIKSPITAIKASVDLLSSADGNIAEQARARLMRALQSGITRLEMLVEESLDYARMQSAQLELRLAPTDMAKIVDEVVGLLSSPIRAKNQRLTIDIEPGLPKLLIDAPRIERIVLNLVSNANKFTPNGGALTVRVHMEGAEVVTEVSDTGPGIPEQDQQFLFREFYRGSNADGQRNAGTGLGLAIAKYLVELHGGRIGLRSSLGDGTTFYFTLPFIAALADEVGEPAEADATAHGAGAASSAVPVPPPSDLTPR